MSVSRLLATLSLTDAGITVQFPEDQFWRWTLQSQTGDHHLVTEDLRWQCTWDQLRHALAARGSLVLIRKDGARCRFKSLRHHQLRKVRESLVAHQVEVQRVRTTAFHYLATS